MDTSPPWVSKELRFTSHTRVGTLALINVDTIESCSLIDEPVGEVLTRGPRAFAVE